MSLPEYPWKIDNAQSKPCPECHSTETHWHGKLFCRSCSRTFRMTKEQAYGDAICYKCGHSSHPNGKCERCVKALAYWTMKAQITNDKSWISKMKCA